MSNFKMKGDYFGPKKSLMGGPIKVNYRVKIDSDGILVAMYHGAKKIGTATAYPITRYALDPLDGLTTKCANNVRELAELFPETCSKKWQEAEGPTNTHIRILEHWRTAELDPSYRSKGIGKALYLAVAAEWFDLVGPFIYIPHECAHGTTSADARRVWDSLARIFPSSGRAIAILKRPKLPSEITL